MSSVSIGRSAYPAHKFRHTQPLLENIMIDLGAGPNSFAYSKNKTVVQHLQSRLQRLLREELSFEIKDVKTKRSELFSRGTAKLKRD